MQNDDHASPSNLFFVYPMIIEYVVQSKLISCLVSRIYYATLLYSSHSVVSIYLVLLSHNLR